MIDIEKLREFIAYDPISGKFYWKYRDIKWFKAKGNADYWNKTYAFRECMKTLDAQGYMIGSFENNNQYAHRVAWAIVHGKWPTGEIDHINGIRHDNRFENLRHVSRSQNGRNQGVKTNNKSGVTGVHWDKLSCKWVAMIKLDGVNKHIGQYDIFSEAVAARKAAEVTLGFHPNHGTRPAVRDYRTKV